MIAEVRGKAEKAGVGLYAVDPFCIKPPRGAQVSFSDTHHCGNATLEREFAAWLRLSNDSCSFVATRADLLGGTRNHAAKVFVCCGKQ
jgi:hypothetical protein